MSLNEMQSAEIKGIKSESFQTRRPTVANLENLLYEPIPVLDHGFVRLIDYMGDDNAIVQAARVSYGKGTKKLTQDKGLINYLMRHRHTTPFEMCEIKFHIKLPIFIARQWIRHRTASVNEYSARYSILDKEFYIPKADNMASQATINNQGRGDLLSSEDATRLMDLLREDSERCYANYKDMINEDESGNIIDESKPSLARELARMNLNLNYYTQWYWKIDLHNLLHFLSLRADSHAQYEIRAYAEIMLDIVKNWVPFAYEAFIKYNKNGIRLSEAGLDTVRKMIKGQEVTQSESGMGLREWREFMEIISDKKLQK